MNIEFYVGETKVSFDNLPYDKTSVIEVVRSFFNTPNRVEIEQHVEPTHLLPFCFRRKYVVTDEMFDKVLRVHTTDPKTQPEWNHAIIASFYYHTPHKRVLPTVKIDNDDGKCNFLDLKSGILTIRSKRQKEIMLHPDTLAIIENSLKYRMDSCNYLLINRKHQAMSQDSFSLILIDMFQKIEPNSYITTNSIMKWHRDRNLP